MSSSCFIEKLSLSYLASMLASRFSSSFDKMPGFPQQQFWPASQKASRPSGQRLPSGPSSSLTLEDHAFSFEDPDLKGLLTDSTSPEAGQNLQPCVPGKATAFPAQVWGPQECALNPKKVRLYQELLHWSPATQSTAILGRPIAARQDLRQRKAQASDPRSGNAAEARLLKNMDTKVRTGRPRS